MRLSIIKLITSIVFVVLFTVGNQSAYAGNSIRDTSIAWGDTFKRLKLLSYVPGWSDADMRLMFDAYQHSEKNSLPKIQSPHQYNIQFINGLWGPLHNPFAKVHRPAKAYVSFTHSSEYILAPLVKNTSDGNYYIFDRSHNNPVLLNDWITNLMTGHGGESTLRFNICPGYTDNINAPCNINNYQQEIADALGSQRSVRGEPASGTEIPSARRELHEHWQSKAWPASKSVRHAGNSIYSSSVEWQNEHAKNRLLISVAAWSDYKTIVENFVKIRDMRYFNDNYKQNFMRRISWLYPDDGCWTRATAVIKDLFGPFHNPANQFTRPSKIFVFGNLCVKTSNSANGYVSWWYHTAPVVRDAQTNKIYVLDPAVEPARPLPVDDWMARISDNSGECGHVNYVSSFNICNGYGTGPNSVCSADYTEEEATDQVQPQFQTRERQRQVDLGRNADAVLGDTPPWLQ